MLDGIDSSAGRDGGRHVAYLDRARDLLRSALAVDFVPLGEPCIPTERHLDVMNRGFQAGLPFEEVQRRMLDDRLDELRESVAARAAVNASWRSAGVRATIVTLGGREIDPTRWDAILRDAAYWHARQRLDGLRICLDADDCDRLQRDDAHGVIFGLQDSAAIGEDMERLEPLWQFGLRVAQITYNTRNLLGDGCKEAADGGLSNLGRRFVAELNRRGIVVDISHCGARTGMDAIERSTAPVAVTHSFCGALVQHPRSKSDDLLRALRDRDGYFGIVAIPSFLNPNGPATLDDFVDHVRHAADIVGCARVGIGTDYGWITPDTPAPLLEQSHRKFVRLGFAPQDLFAHGKGIAGFWNWADWPNLVAALLAAGFADNEVVGIMGGNWNRFFRRVTDARSNRN